MGFLLEEALHGIGGARLEAGQTHKAREAFASGAKAAPGGHHRGIGRAI